LEQRLLVLGVVVLGVLGNVAELTRDSDAVGYLAPLVVRQVLDLLLELFVPLWSKDDVLHNCPFRKKRGAWRAVAGGNSSYTGRRSQPNRHLRFPLYAGKSSRALAHRAGSDPKPARSRPDGGRQRAGLSAAGPALRRRARLLGDGVVRRAAPWERAHARVPAHRIGRAAAGGADLRL